MSLETVYHHFTAGKDEAINWFRGEVGTLRTGRVKPELVESLVIEHYGARVPLKGTASISNSDARTLVIAPWDPTALTAIKKALVDAELGVQPIEDGKVLRLALPLLTAEIREQTIRLLHKKAEEARVRFRRTRDESLSTLKEGKQDGTFTEDDFYEGKKKLDALIDEANEEIAQLVAAKESEIKTI